MAVGIQKEVRRAILIRLKAVPAVTDLVPNIYGQTVPDNPAWPFVKLGQSQTLPIRGSVTHGATVNTPVGGFAKARTNGSGQVIETAEDHASAIGAAIEAALDRYGVDRTGGGRISFLLADILFSQDGAEAGAFHWSATIRARVIAP